MTIQYSILQSDVSRVENSCQKKLSQHESTTVPRRREWNLAMNAQYHDQKNSTLSMSTCGGWKLYEDGEDDGILSPTESSLESPSTSLKINIASLRSQSHKTPASTATTAESAAKRGNAQLSTKVSNISSSALLDKRSAINSSTVNSSHNNYRDKRLPHLILGSKLDEILMVCWTNKGNCFDMITFICI